MEKQNSRYRWVVFATVLFAYFLIVSQRTAPGLITDQLMIDFKVTASTIGLLTSVQFLAYSSLQVPIGLLSDRYGPNLFLIVGALLNGIGTVMYSLAPNEYFLLFSRLLVGIGDATIWVNLVLILSQWFKVKEFISLLGFAGMSGSLGFLMATFPFSAWIDLTGWRMAFLTTGILLCLCGFILYYVLVKKPKQLFKQEEKKKATREKPESTIVLLRRLVTDRQAWATFLCHFGLVGTYVGFIGSWAVPYGIYMYDMTRSEASQLIMIGLVGAIIGAPVSTWLSNRLGTIKLPYVIVHFIILISWITLFLFAGKPPFYLLIILFLLIGFGNGASALTFATVRQSFPMRVVGVVSGFANTGGFLSAVLLPSIFGKILDHFPGALGYQYGLLIPLIFSLLGCMGGLLIKGQQTEVSTGLHA